MTVKQANIIIPKNPDQAYNAVAHEIEAISEDSIITITTAIPRAVGIVLGAADRLQELAPAIQTLPYFDFDNVAKIRLYAAACLQAHLMATKPEAPDPALAEALAEGSKLRADLLNSAELLAHFGYVHAGRVAAIRAGSGHVDMANDLVQLAYLFREMWTRVRGLTPVERDMVERAAVLGLDLHAQLGARRIADDAIAPATQAQLTRSRAFTLLVGAYDQCRRAVHYLRWHEGDANAITPSLYAKRRRRSASLNEKTIIVEDRNADGEDAIDGNDPVVPADLLN